jgi:hypothetical protein
MPVLKDFKFSQTLNADHILRAQGADPQSIRIRRPAIVEIAEWALKEGIALLEPNVVYRQLRVKKLRHERLELEGEEGGETRYSLSGSLIAQHLGPAEQVVILVCTIGSMLESIASDVMATNPLQGWALDGLGSAAVEALALEATNYFEENSASQGLQTSTPLSPGMIGWPVDQGQGQIFSILDTRPIGVFLTSDSLMIPRKSLSMVLGFGVQIDQAGRTCDFCNLKETCRYQNHYAASS